MKRNMVAAALAATALLAFAEGDDGWRLTVGPAWRARVKSSISGRGSVAGVAASRTVTADRDVAGHGPWRADEVVTVQDPDNPGDPSARMYAATRTVTETVVTPSGTQVRLDGSDVDRPLGVKAALGYDIWSAGRFSLGLDLTFAAYWNMRSAASGSAGGGRIDVRRTTEYYLFGSGPIPDDTDFTSFQPDAEPYRRDTVDLAPTEIAGHRLHARIRSDLYQVGLGPRATWRVCDGLDAYGRVEALCNLAHLDFDTGASRTGETKCMPGVGGTVGLAAALAEGVSLYAEAGYEWIDAAETKLGRAQAEVDFSGLVLGAGVAVSF